MLRDDSEADHLTDPAAAGAPRPLTQRDYDRTYDAKNPGRRRARYERLKTAGLCIACGQEDAITETRCGECALRLCESNSFRYR